MKKILFFFIALSLLTVSYAQNREGKKKEKKYNEKGEIIKTGWVFGPLPVVGFDSDLGFQYGITTDIFNYGNGKNYPKYDFKMNFEASTYTKGSSILRFYGDFGNVIPKSKLFLDVAYLTDKKYEFYGFNGYAAPFIDNAYLSYVNPLDQDSPVQIVDDPSVSSFLYNFYRRQIRVVTGFRYPIGFVDNLYYAAGIAFYNIKIDTVRLDGIENQISLYELYCKTGLIKDNEKDGGSVTQLRLGLIYDTRDNESDPAKGLYVEGTLAAAPDIIDKENYSYLTLTMILQHYVPVYNDHLTFAYRLGVQSVLAGNIPFYAVSNLNTMFYKKMITEVLGGITSIRGINRNSVIGAGVGWLNTELRYRALRFKFINQNWIIGCNLLFDAGMVIKDYRLHEQENAFVGLDKNSSEIVENLLYTGERESLHTSMGAGLKVIMNRSFVVSAECAHALNEHDGNGLKFYIGFNYIF